MLKESQKIEMAMNAGITKNTEMSQADVHKGSGIAVENDKKRWYIAECKPTKEKIIRTMLEKAEYQVYIASRVENKIYKSRNRYKKETVVIPGKVFVHTEETKLMSIMLEYSSVHRFMINRTAKNNPYAYVPMFEMQQLQFILGKAENPVLLTTENLKVDQKVKVMRGPLAGLEGWFYKQGHSSYVVIRVTMGTNHYVYTEISLNDIQPCEQ